MITFIFTINSALYFIIPEKCKFIIFYFNGFIKFNFQYISFLTNLHKISELGLYLCISKNGFYSESSTWWLS